MLRIYDIIRFGLKIQLKLSIATPVIKLYRYMSDDWNKEGFKLDMEDIQQKLTEDDGFLDNSDNQSYR